MRWSHVVFVLFIVVALATTAVAQEDWNARWARGTKALQSQDYNTVVEVFQGIIDEYPDKYGQAYYMLGVAQRGLGQTSNALVNLRKAVELDNGNASWQVVLGQTLLQARQYQEAFAILKAVDTSALSASERSSHALLFANAAAKANRYGEAIDLLNRQASAQPGNASLRAALGVAYEGTGDEQRAYQAFKQAYEADPSDQRSAGEAVRLGKTLGRRATSAATKKRYYGEAAAIAEKLANIAPSLDHYLDAGEAWLGAKNYPKALGWFDKAQSRYPQNIHVRFYRGQCYSSLGRFDDAINELQEALKIGASGKLRTQIYETMGYVYAKQKNYDRAISAYGEAGNQTKVAEMRDAKEKQAQNLQAEEERQKFIRQVEALRKQIEELEKLGQMEDVKVLREQLADLETHLKSLK
jgi:tetratricopeptide (TPR) repeat protein